MATVTNIHNIPERITRVMYPPRKKNPERFSVTDLIGEPLPRTLWIEKFDDLVIDCSDNLIALQGIALHDKIEAVVPTEEEAEHKIETPIDGVVVVGKADIYHDEVISDVKQTKVWGPTYQETLDKWTAQTNIYAWQYRKLGKKVVKLVADVFYKDWSVTKKQFTARYPKIAYEEIELPLWDFDRQEQYVRQQLEFHRMNPHIECSMEGKWQRFEIKKKDRKTPLYTANNAKEANRWMADFKKKKGVDCWAEKSDPLNCMFFCNSRSVCPHAKGRK